MLTIAILSDIHANLPAFNAVLRDIDAQKVDQIFCLGDLVDFAPWPNEVIDIIRQQRIPTLMGNHDERIAFDQPLVPLRKHNFRETEARTAAVEYTRKTVTEANKAFLASLPRQLQLSFSFADTAITILLVHASTRTNNEYVYEDHDQDDLLAMMNEKNADVLIMGHTHLSYIRSLDDSDSVNGFGRAVPPVAINSGSVGRSKEADGLATYLLITISGEQAAFGPDSITYELVKVNYPVEQTVDGIHASSIPDFYADFLQRGVHHSSSATKK